MGYKADYVGYELGRFLHPIYKGHENCGVFFLLLQNPSPDETTDMFSIKVGKTRSLKAEFYADCLKVLIYFATDGGHFSVYPIELKMKPDGSKYFDAESFLIQKGIGYSMPDTSHFRHFKAYIHKYSREIMLKEDLSEFSVIHRRISADDSESLMVYRNTKEVLRKAYFVTIRAFGSSVRYRMIAYLLTEEDVMNYLKNEFSGTDGEEIIGYTMEQLMEGKSYNQSQRMGTGTTTTHVQVIYSTNLPSLYRFLDSVEVKDRAGQPVLLSQYLQKANSIRDVENVIDVFNDACDNYW